MLVAIAVIGLFIYGAFFMFTDNVLNRKRSQLNMRQEEVALPQELGSAGWEVSIVIQEKKSVSIEVNNLKTSYSAIGDFLGVLVKGQRDSLLPSEIWLQDLVLQDQSGKWTGSFRGKAFLDDARKERESIDNFVYDFSRNDIVRGIFKSIELGSTTRGAEGEFNLTSFDVSLR